MLGRHAPGQAGKPTVGIDARLLTKKQSRRGTVLVVDDEIALLAIITEVLQESGYTVLSAHDGPAGLAIIASDRPIDMLITDILLPKGMNGREVAEAALRLRPYLKVLYMTGYAGSILDGAGSTADIMTKPFDLLRLPDRIRDLIGE